MAIGQLGCWTGHNFRFSMLFVVSITSGGTFVDDVMFSVFAPELINCN